MIARAGFTTMTDGVRVRNLRMNQAGLNKWLHQNRATIEDLEEVLLDNYLVSCKRGWAIVRELSTTAWTSVYKATFYPAKSYSESLVWDLWEEFVTNYEN